MNSEEKKELPAISVPDEAGRVYYDNFMQLPKHLRIRISCEMLDNIFKKMVIPAIDKTRSLDRGA